MTSSETGARSRLEVPARRLVWCSAGGRLLHGRTRPAPAPTPGFLQKLLGIRPHGGSIFEFESVECSAAQAALEAHLSTPGTFSIETAEGARLDFHATRPDGHVAVESWFLDGEEELDEVLLSPAAARQLLASVYELRRDREVAARLRQLARGQAAA